MDHPASFMNSLYKNTMKARAPARTRPTGLIAPAAALYVGTDGLVEDGQGEVVV